MKRVLFLCIAVAALIVPPVGVNAGNGAPNGRHYNLNIIGVPRDKTADMTGTSGHSLFVKLWGTTKIWLAPGDDFLVIDRNGTDGSATFQLPNPVEPGSCPAGAVSCTAKYSVFARAPGNSGGSANLTTCATDPATGATICSVQVFVVTQSSKFQNVTKYLLFVYWDTDGNPATAPQLIPIFDSRLQGYYWAYDDKGLKLLQLRFYPCQTTVFQDGTQTSTCVLTGN